MPGTHPVQRPRALFCESLAASAGFADGTKNQDTYTKNIFVYIYIHRHIDVDVDIEVDTDVDINTVDVDTDTSRMYICTHFCLYIQQTLHAAFFWQIHIDAASKCSDYQLSVDRQAVIILLASTWSLQSGPRSFRTCWLRTTERETVDFYGDGLA